MDIGTGKDKSFKQDLIDIINPDHPYTLYDYQKTVEALIEKYLQMKSLPILVGGTGLYLNSVLYGYVLPNLKEQSQKLREKLETLSQKELFEQLIKYDPISAKKIDPKNKRRIIRALEVSILTKKPFSHFQKKLRSKFKTLMIGIDVPRETLYARIDARVDEMIRKGLVKEVKDLISKYRTDLPSLNSIGYREIIDYLEGKQTLKEAIQKIKFNTHDYARRQLTWFRKDRNIKWVTNYDQAERLIRRFLKS
jgi:tRNA dimethylallyltransferase